MDALKPSDLKSIEKKVNKLTKSINSHIKDLGNVDYIKVKDLIKMLKDYDNDDSVFELEFDYFGNCSSSAYITSYRPETDEEFEKRKNDYRKMLIEECTKKKEAEVKKLEKEKAEYERLKKKFEKK